MAKQQCDFCKKSIGAFEGSVRYNNRVVTYHLCRDCADALAKEGYSPADMVKELIEKRGKFCPGCGTGAEEFERTMRLGCSECYANMRSVVREKIRSVQNGNSSFVADLPMAELPPINLKLKRYRDVVVSSRVRYARNTTVGVFPWAQSNTVEDARNSARIVKAAAVAAKECFDGVYEAIDGVESLERLAMIERHEISPELVDNALKGVVAGVILQNDKDKTGAECRGISVMLNEEDQIRVQSIADGFDLRGARNAAKRYCDALQKHIPLAYDDEFGWLTACTTNVGTGMRASVMTFLPCVKAVGSMNAAVERLETQGITVRGVYGENSVALGDLYQLSNTFSMGVSENAIICAVERAVDEMATAEENARRILVERAPAEFANRIARSYALLVGAVKISHEELFELVSDVKLGLQMGAIENKLDQRLLDSLPVLCSRSSLKKNFRVQSEEELDLLRGQIVKKVLLEGK